jgi:CdiI immunity protein
MTTYPTLRYFFGAYMHHDWREDYATEWAALEDFMRSDPAIAANFCQEVSKLLATDPSEDALRTLLLDEYLAAAMVENRGWKYRDWLQALSDHTAKAIGHPQAS